MRLHRDIDGGDTVSVYLDGEKLLRCIIADDVEGWAACMFEDAQGRHVLMDYVDRQGAYMHDGQIVTEIRRGVVTFTFDPPEGREWVEAALVRLAEARRNWRGERG